MTTPQYTIRRPGCSYYAQASTLVEALRLREEADRTVAPGHVVYPRFDTGADTAMRRLACAVYNDRGPGSRVATLLRGLDGAIIEAVEWVEVQREDALEERLAAAYGIEAPPGAVSHPFECDEDAARWVSLQARELDGRWYVPVAAARHRELDGLDEALAE